MSILDNIKRKFSDFSFNRRSKRPRNVIALNIKAAEKVGIIYRADSEESFELVKRYVKFLREYKIKVRTIGFFDEIEIPSDVNPKLEFDYFCKKDLNFQLEPKCVVVDNFIDEEFDILIDVTVDDDKVLRNLVCWSKATFKIGASGKKSAEDLDFMIDLKEGEGVRQLMKGVDHYLHLINTD